MSVRNDLASPWLAMALVVAASGSPGERTLGQTAQDATPAIPQTRVGQVGIIKEVVLPGPRWDAAPITEDRPQVVLRIANAFPHGTAWRYDVEYYGLEPGTFDLRDFLHGPAGSSRDDLPPLPVVIVSGLPDGQIVPQPLETAQIPRIGGYRLLAIVFGLFWCAGFLAILFARRHARVLPQDAPASPTSLQEYLEARLHAIRQGTLSADDYAELERMIVASWRERLGFGDMETQAARRHLQQHPIAGPMLHELQEWMHRPLQRTRSLSDLIADWDRRLAQAESVRPDEALCPSELAT